MPKPKSCPICHQNTTIVPSEMLPGFVCLGCGEYIETEGSKAEWERTFQAAKNRPPKQHRNFGEMTVQIVYQGMAA